MCFDLNCDGSPDLCCCFLPLSCLLGLCCCRDYAYGNRYNGYAVPTGAYIQPGAYPAAYYTQGGQIYNPAPVGTYCQPAPAYSIPIYHQRSGF